MPYKISGNLGDDAKIIVIKESDYSIEATEDEVAGEYEVLYLENNTKLVVATKSDGQSLALGQVTPEAFGGGGSTGVFAGGIAAAGGTNVIDYINILSTGDAQNFGDLTKAEEAQASVGDSNRAVFTEGLITTNVLTYITITSLGNVTDFGDMTANHYLPSGASNHIQGRGVFFQTDATEYITIDTTGDSVAFGDLLGTRDQGSATSNGNNNRAIFGGGFNVVNLNTIEYLTISSLGNSASFGELNASRRYTTATSNLESNRALFAGGLTTGSVFLSSIEYLTITSLGDAAAFGNLSGLNVELGSTTNGNRGVWAGGWLGPKDTIEYSVINTLGDVTDFGNLTLSRRFLAGESNA